MLEPWWHRAIVLRFSMVLAMLLVACGSGTSNELTRPLKAVPTQTTTLEGQASALPTETPSVGMPEIPAPTPLPRPQAAPAAPQAPLPCKNPVRRAPSAPTTDKRTTKGTKVALTVNVERRTYLAQGCTDRELKDSAVQNIPRKPADRTIGLTAWGTSIDYTFSSAKTSCSMTTATILLTVVVSVPEAATREGIAGAELTKWDAEVDRIRTHEQRHVDIDIAGAKRLQSALESVKTAATCPDVERSIKATADRITEDVKAENRNFDAEDQARHLGAQ